MIPKDVLDRLPPETRRVLDEALGLVPRSAVPASERLEALVSRAAEAAEAPGPVTIARLTVAALEFLVEALGETRDEEAARRGVAGGAAAYAESRSAGQRAKCAICGQVWQPGAGERHVVDSQGNHLIEDVTRPPGPR